MSLDRIFKALVGLGLSHFDAEVYIHLAKSGPVTVRSIINDTALNKRRVYRTLKTLQRKGIAFRNQEYPAEFYAVSFENALNLLLEMKKEQAKSLETNKSELTSGFQAEKIKSKESN